MFVDNLAYNEVLVVWMDDVETAVIEEKYYGLPCQVHSDLLMRKSVGDFIEYARKHHNIRFIVSRMGCKNSAVKIDKVASLFSDCLEITNVALPKEYWAIIDKEARKRKYANDGDARALPGELHHAIEKNPPIKTSNYGPHSIDVQVVDCQLIIRSGYANKHISVLVLVVNYKGEEVLREYVHGSSVYCCTLPVQAKSGGVVFLYFQKTPNAPYIMQMRIPYVRLSQGAFAFRKRYWGNNSWFYSQIPSNKEFLDKASLLTAVDPGAITEFRNIANKITKYDTDDYCRLQSIHDWIAKNIFYDYDSLANRSYQDIPIERTAILALREKKCVCQGYTDLSKALLRVVGIPAIGICCWADGEHLHNDSGHTNASNHVFTAAYCMNRWVLCDITWDSKNRYENDNFDEDKQLSHTYFDVSLDFLSITHRMNSIQV